MHYLQLGDVIACRLCGSRVAVTDPPPADFQNDPWPGSTENRFAVHWFVKKVPPQ